MGEIKLIINYLVLNIVERELIVFCVSFGYILFFLLLTPFIFKGFGRSAKGTS